MSIKFWTRRHRTILYNFFDEVRLNNFALLDQKFVADMLDQKITQKAQRRIEGEWLVYWENVYGKRPRPSDKVIVYKINPAQFMLLKSGQATNIANLALEKNKIFFESKVGIIQE